MRLLRILAIALTMAVVVTADGVPTVVTYVPASKVTATMAKGGQIIGDHGLIVLAQRRGAGEVEVHDKTNHVFIIVEGEATFIRAARSWMSETPLPASGARPAFKAARCITCRRAT